MVCGFIAPTVGITSKANAMMNTAYALGFMPAILASAASTKQMPQAHFALRLRNAPTPKATFPSFDLAWDSALGMFIETGATICGCHFIHAIGCEPPHAEFMVATGGKVEEYVISASEAS